MNGFAASHKEKRLTDRYGITLDRVILTPEEIMRLVPVGYDIKKPNLDRIPQNTRISEIGGQSKVLDWVPMITVPIVDGRYKDKHKGKHFLVYNRHIAYRAITLGFNSEAYIARTPVDIERMDFDYFRYAGADKNSICTNMRYMDIALRNAELEGIRCMSDLIAKYANGKRFALWWI